MLNTAQISGAARGGLASRCALAVRRRAAGSLSSARGGLGEFNELERDALGLGALGALGLDALDELDELELDELDALEELGTEDDNVGALGGRASLACASLAVETSWCTAGSAQATAHSVETPLAAASAKLSNTGCSLSLAAS